MKDYGHENQISFGDSSEDYINNLNFVWQECIRILKPGCRLCINIGDQFARAIIYGRYKVISIQSEINPECQNVIQSRMAKTKSLFEGGGEIVFLQYKKDQATSPTR